MKRWRLWPDWPGSFAATGRDRSGARPGKTRFASASAWFSGEARSLRHCRWNAMCREGASEGADLDVMFFDGLFRRCWQAGVETQACSCKKTPRRTARLVLVFLPPFCRGSENFSIRRLEIRLKKKKGYKFISYTPGNICSGQRYSNLRPSTWLAIDILVLQIAINS